MAELVLEQISKTFANGVVALRDVSFHVGNGELLSVVGPSGCGKTTLLRIIAGLEEPSAGNIRIDGVVVNHLPPLARNVGMVFQRPALYPHLTVRDNLAFGERMRRGPAWPFSGQSRAQRESIDRAVHEAAITLGIEGLLGRRPAELSGGQQQRVALGRALVRNPRVFLLDEPLSGLDIPLRAEIRRELHLFHEGRRATMIYVSHDQHEALTLGQRVVVLAHGAVQQVGGPGELLEKPANRFVAGFIGWPPMNFLDGEIVRSGSEVYFVSMGCRLALPHTIGSKDFCGRLLTLGVRPGDLSPKAEPTGGLTARLKLIETIGATSLLAMEWEGRPLLMQIGAGQAFEIGQSIAITMNMNRVHLFDRSSGASVWHGCRTG
jgi:multiple sugar transport system ATP-binding protein